MTFWQDPYSVQNLLAVAETGLGAQRRWESSMEGALYYGAMEQAKRDAELAHLINRPHMQGLLHGPDAAYLYRTGHVDPFHRGFHSWDALYPQSSVRLATSQWLVDKFLEENKLRATVGATGYLQAFDHAAMVNDLIAAERGVTRNAYEAAHSLSREIIPHFETVGQYGRFLDAAGLYFPRNIVVRPISSSERKVRLQAILNRNAQPKHVARTMADVYRFERTLREVIHIAMAREYGEDWAEYRLPICGCSKLLGRWHQLSAGETVIDEADFTQYISIIEFPEHFEKVFSAGFDDPQFVTQLLGTIRQLRNRPYHSRDFSSTDSRRLRLAMNQVIRGLDGLLDAQEIIWTSAHL